MVEEVKFKVNLKGDLLQVRANGDLIYCSVLYQIVKRMGGINKSVSFDLFIFSEILEFNDNYTQDSFEFSKAFLYFAKEYNNYDTYRN